MKKLLTLLLLSTSLSAFADLEYDFSLSDFCHKQPGVQERDGVYYFPNKPEGITATSICVHKDSYGQYIGKGNLKNGRFHGFWTGWHKNGQKEFEGTFINGELVGETISWNANGQITKKATIKEGELATGFIRTYYDKTGLYDGKNLLRSEENYKDNMLNGKSYSWYEKGQLVSEYNYKDGVWDGKQLEWYENGQLATEFGYKDHKRHGQYLEWYDNGQLKHSGMHAKYGELDLEDGKWFQWYKNGQKKSEGTVLNNQSNGKHTEWYENGHYKSVGFFKHDKKEGKWTDWTEDGQIKSTVYKDGICISGDYCLK